LGKRKDPASGVTLQIGKCDCSSKENQDKKRRSQKAEMQELS
jgi:hypothetical protein